VPAEPSTAVTWLDRLRALRPGGRRTRVALQWLGNEMAVARVRQGGPRPLIEKIAVLPAPVERRADVVKRLIDDGTLAAAPVVVLLAPGQYDLQQLPVPAVPDEEMRDALRWQLRSHLAYAPEEAMLDFTRLPRAAEQKDALLAVAAHRPMIEAALAPLLQHGVTVDAVDVPEFAQRNLAGFQRSDGVTSAWLGFERDTCLLTVQMDGELAFTRRMLMPGAAVNAIDSGLPDSAQHVSERVVVQVQRSLDLFERQSGLPSLAHAMLGPHPHAPLIALLLAERCALRVDAFDAAKSFEFMPGATTTELPTAALGALGAAMRVESQGAAAPRTTRLQALRRKAA